MNQHQEYANANAESANAHGKMQEGQLELELQMDLDRIYLELERFSREGLFSELEKLWGEVTKEIWYNIDHIRKL